MYKNKFLVNFISVPKIWFHGMFILTLLNEYSLLFKLTLTYLRIFR